MCAFAPIHESPVHPYIRIYGGLVFERRCTDLSAVCGSNRGNLLLDASAVVSLRPVVILILTQVFYISKQCIAKTLLLIVYGYIFSEKCKKIFKNTKKFFIMLFICLQNFAKSIIINSIIPILPPCVKMKRGAKYISANRKWWFYPFT